MTANGKRVCGAAAGILACCLRATAQDERRVSASDGPAEQGFGEAVTVDGAWAIVGAPGDRNRRGAAYAFACETADRTWSQRDKWVGSDPRDGAEFGAAVDLSGSYAFVGAPFYRVPGSNGIGRVFVFRRDGAGAWTETQRLDPPVPYTNATQAFGASVAVRGEYALVGDPRASVNQHTNKGVAHVYRNVAGIWQWQQSLHRDFDEVSGFGASVSVHAPCAIVGAPDGGGGQAFVYERVGAAWLPAEIRAADGNGGDRFGHAVRIYVSSETGLMAAVGAPGQGTGDVLRAGAVYVFKRDGGWRQIQRVAPAERRPGAGFGASVALWGDGLLVSAPCAAACPAGLASNAPAYLFSRHRGGADRWGEYLTIAPGSGPASGARFGGASNRVGVAMQGGVALVGAPRDDGDGQPSTREGAAYFFNSAAIGAALPADGALLFSELSSPPHGQDGRFGYLQVRNLSSVAVAVGGLALRGWRNDVWTDLAYGFPSFVCIPSTGCLLVANGARKPEFEAAWNVRIDPDRVFFDPGTNALGIGAAYAYGLTSPSGTLHDATAVLRSGCRLVRGSLARDDWALRSTTNASPGAVEAEQSLEPSRSTPFAEDWSSGKFAADAWSFDPFQGNWRINSGCAQFYWSPRQWIPFTSALVGPVMNGKVKATVTLRCDVGLDMAYAYNQPQGYQLAVQVGGLTGVWQTVATYRDAGVDQSWLNQTIDITRQATGRLFRVRFLISGDDTAYLDAWSLDNVSIAGPDVLRRPQITQFTLGRGGARLGWTPAPGATAYRIDAADGPGARPFVDVTTNGALDVAVWRESTPASARGRLFRIRALRERP